MIALNIHSVNKFKSIWILFWREFDIYFITMNVSAIRALLEWLYYVPDYNMYTFGGSQLTLTCKQFRMLAVALNHFTLLKMTYASHWVVIYISFECVSSFIDSIYLVGLFFSHCSCARKRITFCHGRLFDISSLWQWTNVCSIFDDNKLLLCRPIVKSPVMENNLENPGSKKEICVFVLILNFF